MMRASRAARVVALLLGTARVALCAEFEFRKVDRQQPSHSYGAAAIVQLVFVAFIVTLIGFSVAAPILFSIPEEDRSGWLTDLNKRTEHEKEVWVELLGFAC